ncbi:AGE family epimerase/isomerase [Phocaeicola paurosaccharolyticus]|uniref:AGE family epimerase/isomerase n=1 Tax=Phocaeicola paurosaccharolyticus TaxID=732242 RepID=UPI000469A204|nr:AGE family epimerase/isomerase [Phocaeicola paurosaccharolyticus]
MNENIITTLKSEVNETLLDNILPYWIEKMTDVQGGFYGRIDGNDNHIKGADKGAILNARILWTFSAAYRLFKKPEYLQMATRAKRVIINGFFDKEFGGIYWSLKDNGEPKDTKKQIYAIGFAIYGLSEYYRATSDTETLDYAISLFESIEKYSFDNDKNGYCEALTREWNEIDDMRLSEKDANERKTMNTHLHILEPYTNLYRVWKDERLERQIRNLIDIFTDKILDKETSHLNLFFDDNWNSKYRIVSYGHDIEASWLIDEAVSVLEDKDLKNKILPIIKKIADAASQGLTTKGSMIYEKNLEKGTTDRDSHWWVQAETVIGYLNMYQHTNDDAYLSKAIKCWEFIKNNLIDYDNGEWYWSISDNGEVNRKDDKAGFWKCPYHNGRMCMEIIERF